MSVDGEGVIDYDETTRDGCCLTNDFAAEINLDKFE